MRYFIHSLFFLLLPFSVFALDEEFSFSESLDNLSSYEQTIVRSGVLEKSDAEKIRQALLVILQKSDAQLSTLDTQIGKKRERLAALLEKPSEEPKPDSENTEPLSIESTVDQALLRNKETLEFDLVTLETARKKASLVSVYANDLIVQLAAKASEQSQQQLLYKAPSFLSAESWRIAYKSGPAVYDAISVSIMQWIAGVLLLGVVLVFVVGPVLHRQFQQTYNRFMPTNHYPRWSFLTVYVLVLIANCFYFLFVTQDRYLEFTFLVLLILNTALGAILLKLLASVSFMSRESIIDGEPVLQERRLFTFFISLVKLLIVLATSASIFGYSVLGMYVLHNIVITLTAILLFLSLRSLWINSERTLNSKKAHSGESIDKNQGSIFILTTVELGLAVGLFLVTARFWGVSLNNFEGQSSLMRGEFQIGSLTIEFSQLLSGILAFVLVFYFFKLVRWFLRERIFKAMRLSVSASEAILAILGYMGFTFAIIASLNALGVQWENLAIIAGALSVGIGFGLQTIISNFVSGLILLFERPVRVGDWVILGNGLEGHIKKVNMRSTEIMTLERSSVLIPNSNLLSDTITNWTLHDKMGRQDIGVGVAYGSDTALVKKVLLGVAAEHSLLRRYPSPTVLFLDFGDSSLDFILRVFLKNIDDRHRVGSDLRFAIDEAFRQNNIVIPFPQRDLHVIEPNTDKGMIEPEQKED